MILVLLGRREESLYYIDQLKQRQERYPNIFLDSELANAYGALGDTDEAFRYLEARYANVREVFCFASGFH